MNMITRGARVGIKNIAKVIPQLSKRAPYISMTKNQYSAITDWLIDKVNKGFADGPFDIDYDFPFELNNIPIFTVKKPKPNAWRVIQNCAHKKGVDLCMNDFIPDEESNLRYVSLKENVLICKTAGPNGHLFTRDLEDGFYKVPLHPSQYPLMGMKWCGKIWIFKVLPQGLKSSPRIFARFGDAIEYMIVSENKDIAFVNGIQMVRHYCDDFFGVGRNLEEATRLYDATGDKLASVNVHAKAAKDCDPQPSRKLLGHIYELRFGGFLSLSEQRRFTYLTYLITARDAGFMYHKQAEILDGSLNCVAVLKFPAKAMLRRFHAVIHDPRLHSNDVIIIDEFLRADIDWWIDFLMNPANCRISFDTFLKKPDDGDIEIYTDASGEIGVGGIIGDTIAFQIKWSQTIWYDVMKIRPEMDIQVQEALGPLIAMQIARELIKDKSVTIYNDNPGAAAALITKAPPLWRNDMQFITREIAMLAIENNTMYWGIKIDGKHNEYTKSKRSLTEPKLPNTSNIIRTLN